MRMSLESYWEAIMKARTNEGNSVIKKLTDDVFVFVFVE